jgi:hypothetical protein
VGAHQIEHAFIQTERNWEIFTTVEACNSFDEYEIFGNRFDDSDAEFFQNF